MKLPTIRQVTDVQGDPEYQKKDIDLIIETDENSISIEIKTDSYYDKSPNLFLEVESNVERQVPGCFIASEADYFFYYFDPGNILYAFPLEDGQKWLEENEHRFRSAFAKNYNEEDKYIYKSRGYLVPRDIFAEECPGTIVVKLPDETARLEDFLQKEKQYLH